jgi:hypothetical protein
MFKSLLVKTSHLSIGAAKNRRSLVRRSAQIGDVLKEEPAVVVGVTAGLAASVADSGLAKD